MPVWTNMLFILVGFILVGDTETTHINKHIKVLWRKGSGEEELVRKGHGDQEDPLFTESI